MDTQHTTAAFFRVMSSVRGCPSAPCDENGVLQRDVPVRGRAAQWFDDQVPYGVIADVWFLESFHDRLWNRPPTEWNRPRRLITGQELHEALRDRSRRGRMRDGQYVHVEQICRRDVVYRNMHETYYWRRSALRHLAEFGFTPICCRGCGRRKRWMRMSSADYRYWNDGYCSEVCLTQAKTAAWRAYKQQQEERTWLRLGRQRLTEVRRWLRDQKPPAA